MKSKILNLTNLIIALTILSVWFITAQFFKPFLHYYFHQTGFLTSYEFFKSYFVNPGGISDYLAEFISQFFLYNTFGSFLIVAIASIQGFIARDLIGRLIGKTKLNYSIFAVILIIGVFVFCDFHYPYYVSIRLLFAFLLIWVFWFLNDRYSKISIYIWPLLAILLFYLASGAALFVFTLSTIFILIKTLKMRILILIIPLMILFAGALPYATYKLLFQTGLQNLYRISMVKPPEMLAYTTFYQLLIYYSLLPVILLFSLFYKEIPANENVQKKVKGKLQPKPAFYKQIPFILSIQVIFCGALAYLIYSSSFEPLKKKLLYIEYYAETEQWEEVLKVAETIDNYDFRVNYQVNRAYEHLGKLPDQLFNYPQLLGSAGLFFDTSSLNGSFTMPISDLYFDLGLMSESLHWAFEGQTLLPNSPRILKRIIVANLVNKKYDLAQKFLNVLDQNMLYHAWVDKYEKYISDTTLAANDPVIAEKRRFNPHKNVVNLNPVDNLKLLLATNKDNRMAYDYLLTLYILDSHLNEFVEYLQNYSYYKIKTLPESWAEALAIYILKTKTIPPFFNSETISKSCMQRFMTFNDIMKQFQNNKDAAKVTLKKDFEGTYWYYILYLSPKVTNVLSKKTEIR
jgi:hypothetical protein